MLPWKKRTKMTNAPAGKKSMQGRPLHRRMCLSVKCMVFCDGELLLLQKKDKEGLRPWEFPGGGLEFGEDFKQAAMREVREETGLGVEILEIAGLWSYARSREQFLTGIIFIAQSKHKKVTLSGEHTAYAWVRPEDFAKYTLQESLQAALAQIEVPSLEGQTLLSYFCHAYKEKLK